MATPQVQGYLTPQEYYQIEKKAAWKSEYFDGEMFAMAGGTAMHSLVATNIAALLNRELRAKASRCRAYNSDLRVRTGGKGLRTYPDVSVICGPLIYDDADDEQTTVVNPTVIVEVLSPSTESYDRGKKFELYQSILSLSQYVLVSQTETKVETFLRQPDSTWQYTSAADASQKLSLRSLGVELFLAEIYEDVEFESPMRLRLI